MDFSPAVPNVSNNALLCRLWRVLRNADRSFLLNYSSSVAIGRNPIAWTNGLQQMLCLVVNGTAGFVGAGLFNSI
jgi:hypothetical protein